MNNQKTIRLAKIAADLLSTKFLIARSRGLTQISITIPKQQARVLERALSRYYLEDQLGVQFTISYPGKYVRGQQTFIKLSWSLKMDMNDAN